MKLSKPSQSKQTFLNIFGCLVVVVINALINFFLSPFIVEHLGVEANGYITLANNFITYASLITMAFDSMAGRFMLIECRKGNIQEANEYYSSVLFADWFIALLLFIPITIFLAFIDKAINIEGTSVSDVRILFALVFISFFLSLCLPKWNNATYVTNNLYLRSIKTAFSTIIRAVTIYCLFIIFSPAVYFIAIAGVIMTVINIICEFYFKKKLLPELRVGFKYFKFQKVKTLFSSGIWNTISKCGGILLDSLDILVANLYVGPVGAGVLSLAKIVPNMIHQISGNITTTFAPKITGHYADGNIETVVKQVKNDIKLTSVICNIPIGIAIVFGMGFFSLWVPSQDSKQLAILCTVTLLGMLASGIGLCIKNIFTMANKLRLISIVTIISGLINVGVVFLLLKFTSLGVYAIVIVSSIVTVLRVFGFTVPYGAICIKRNPFTFFGSMIKGVLNVLIPIALGIVFLVIHPIDSWLIFIAYVVGVALLTMVFDYFIVLNKNEKARINAIISKIFKRKNKEN